MFTGIVRALGYISAVESKGIDARLTVDTGQLELSSIQLGDSIATNGVCLTVTHLLPKGFAADVSGETLQCTTLQKYQVGTAVNLEPALTLNTPLGGHLVSGHVDGVGQVIERHSDGRSERFVLQAPQSLTRYIAAKGSICVDGVSLTVNQVEGRLFELNIVPHTLAHTNFSNLTIGNSVNLEVDLVARYLERLLLGDDASTHTNVKGVDLALLEKTGFIKT